MCIRDSLYDVPIKERNPLIDFCYQKHKNLSYNFEMIDVVSQGAKYVNLADKSLVMYLAKDLTMEPVSYTHLDVYKRQGPGLSVGAGVSVGAGDTVGAGVTSGWPKPVGAQ